MEAEIGSEAHIAKVVTGCAASHTSAARRVRSRHSGDRDSGRLPCYK
jgi:hypothetical protein